MVSQKLVKLSALVLVMVVMATNAKSTVKAKMANGNALEKEEEIGLEILCR